MDRRTQTPLEEFANATSHGIGFLIAAFATPMLMGAADPAQADVVSPRSASVAVFAGTMMLLYLASAVYHALPEGRMKLLANRFDHAAIFLFIAGSYTPFALGALRGTLGWTMFTLAWGVALVGMALKLTNRLRHRLLSTAMYAAMGWLVVLAAGPMIERVGAEGFRWLLAGGIAYSVGVVFFLLDERVRFAHFVWHLFVLTGSACHFVAVLRYAH
jgi:hemolysin III